MNSTLKHLAEILAKANDLFTIEQPTLKTTLGIMDKALRKQGINADAITLDCLALNKKIIVLLHDDKPNLVSIARGNKDGDIHGSSEHALKEITVESMLKILQSEWSHSDVINTHQ